MEESFKSLNRHWDHFEEKCQISVDRWISQTSKKVKVERLSVIRILGGIENVGFKSTMVVDLTHEFRCFGIQEVEKL